MHGGEQRRSSRLDTPMPDVMHEMSRKGLGMTCVVDDDGRLVGIITDGDLRRHMMRADGRRPIDARAGAADVMTPQPGHHRPRHAGGRGARTSSNSARSPRSSSSIAERQVEGRRAPARSLAHTNVLDLRWQWATVPSHCWPSSSPCCSGLVVGKAWERYKLRDGRWIDRRRLRETPHYMLGLNFLVDNQVDQAIEELTQATSTRHRRARDPDDPRQPVPRRRDRSAARSTCTRRCCSART